MTSGRLSRIVRSRWWVLALASILSAVAAAVAIQARNDAIPEYEAVAAITYNRLLGEVDDTLARERLATAAEIATNVNSSELATGIDPLSPEVDAEVVAREPDLLLLFIGRGTTAEEASTIATAMRDRYLDAQKLDNADELSARIAQTTARLQEVVAAIATGTNPPDGGEIENSSRLNELQAEVNTLAALYGSLTAELITPRTPPRPRDTILSERAAASESLRVAEQELSNLEFAVSGSAGDDSDVSLLRAEEAQLRTALDGYVAQSITDEPIGEAQPVEVGPSGVEPTPLLFAIIVGLLAGLFVGIVGLVIVDRVRRPLWEPTELEPRYRLPEVAARPRGRGDASKPWYDNATEGRRKAGIQGLRSSVEGMPGFGAGLVVGIASLNRPSPHVHDLAADLAAGLTSSGSWTLLIDADYGDPSNLPEYRSHGLELEDCIADPEGTIVRAAARTDRGRDLIGVHIEGRRVDAADLLAKPAFAHMLDTAQALHDVVIVSCPATDSASYHVLTQRLDAMILVAVAGDAPPADVVNALHTLDERRALAAGIVLITPRVGPLSLFEDQARRPSPTLDPVTQGSYWQWSKAQETTAPQRSTGGIGEVGRATDVGADEGVSPPGGARTAWPLRKVAPTAGGGADPVPEDHDMAVGGGNGTAQADTGVSAGRIKRRAFSARLTRSEEPAEDAEKTGSPWSFRDVDVPAGRGGSDRSPE
jgi:hypothetical protein